MNQYSNLDSEFVDKILQSLYVDDLISGVDPIAEAKSFFENSKTRSAEGGFHLRKFKSNSSELESIKYLRNFQMI